MTKRYQNKARDELAKIVIQGFCTSSRPDPSKWSVGILLYVAAALTTKANSHVTTFPGVRYLL